MNKYWAAEDAENIAKGIVDKFDAWQRYLLDIGEINKLRKSYKAFYGTVDVEQVDQSLVAIHVNNYASLIRNLHVMVTSNRPAWQPRAINSDLKSQASAELASGLLDFYMREKHLENKLNDAALLALVLKEGWLVLDWDPNAGEPIAVDDEDPSTPTVFEGDISASVHSMLDVARDIYKKSNQNHKWHIVRELKNKYDLAATYPDLSEKILSSSTNERMKPEYELNPNKLISQNYTESDLIPIYKLYHDKTPAVPDGRLAIALDSDTVLFDGPLPYKRPYCFCITPSLQHDMPIGHSNAFDLLPLQDVLDANWSAIVTNQAANAVQNFQVPKGSGINLRSLGDGMNVLEYDPKLGPMQPLTLLQTAPEVFNFGETVNQYMQMLINIGQVARGDAPASMSGAAMALLQQQTIQSNSGLQLSHTIMLENVGTGVIELLQDFAEEPRLAIIAGKMNQAIMKEFSSEDLQGVGRIIVDAANPLTKTAAGRVEIANQLLSRPEFIKTPEQYLSVLLTGNLEPLYEFDRSRQHLVKLENETLMKGQAVQAILTDDHAIHVLEHSCIANNPEARKNPQLLANLFAHIQEHIDMAKNMPPEMAAMLKMTSFAQPAPAPMPQGGGVNPDMGQPVNPITQQAEQVNLPEPAQPAQV